MSWLMAVTKRRSFGKSHDHHWYNEEIWPLPGPGIMCNQPFEAARRLTARLPGCPLFNESFGIRNQSWCHLSYNSVPTTKGSGLPIHTRQSKPHVRLYKVLFDTVTFSISEPQTQLGVSLPLVGSGPIPPDRLCVVLRNAPSLFICGSERKLRTCVTSFCRRMKPPDCLPVVPSKATTLVIRDAETKLGHRISLISGCP